MLAHVRKAAFAGLGAGLAAALAVVLKAGVLDRSTVSQALGAFVSAGAAVGWTTWRVPNEGTVYTGGSDDGETSTV